MALTELISEAAGERNSNKLTVILYDDFNLVQVSPFLHQKQETALSAAPNKSSSANPAY